MCNNEADSKAQLPVSCDLYFLTCSVEYLHGYIAQVQRQRLITQTIANDELDLNIDTKF